MSDGNILKARCKICKLGCTPWILDKPTATYLLLKGLVFFYKFIWKDYPYKGKKENKDGKRERGIHNKLFSLKSDCKFSFYV